MQYTVKLHICSTATLHTQSSNKAAVILPMSSVGASELFKPIIVSTLVIAN